MSDFLNKIRRFINNLFEDQFSKNRSPSVRNFLTEIYQNSSKTLKATAIVLIALALPISVYLATSPESPLKMGHAAGNPTPLPTPLFQTASPSATPTHKPLFR